MAIVLTTTRPDGSVSERTDPLGAPSSTAIGSPAKRLRCLAIQSFRAAICALRIGEPAGTDDASPEQHSASQNLSFNLQFDFPLDDRADLALLRALRLRASSIVSSITSLA